MLRNLYSWNQPKMLKMREIFTFLIKKRAKYTENDAANAADFYNFITKRAKYDEILLFFYFNVKTPNILKLVIIIRIICCICR